MLDVLKPHEPSIVEFAQEAEKVPGVNGVNASLYEIDEEVQNIKVTVEGDEIDFDEIKECIEGLGGSIHSVDEIVYGEKIVEESRTPQDK